MATMVHGIEYLTPDTLAECYDVGPELYRKLWEQLARLDREGQAVPIGGDGSDGTIECPPEPDAYRSGKMGAIWHLFTEEEQQKMNAAYQQELDSWRA